MLKREEVISELERRMWTITAYNGYPLSVVDVKRNPSVPDEMFPCVNVYEMPDRVISQATRSGHPVSKRKIQIVIEFWLEFSDDRAASQEVIDFYNSVRWAIFNDGNTLGGLGVALTEEEATQIVKPLQGRKTVGMGISLSVDYVDSLVNPIT